MNDWTNEKRCHYQYSIFIASLLEEGKIVGIGLGHMLILERITMARGIRSSDWLKFSHASLLCCQGMEENHDGQARIRSRGREVAQREKKKSTVTGRLRMRMTIE